MREARFRLARRAELVLRPNQAFNRSRAGGFAFAGRAG